MLMPQQIFINIKVRYLVEDTQDNGLQHKSHDFVTVDVNQSTYVLYVGLCGLRLKRLTHN